MAKKSPVLTLSQKRKNRWFSAVVRFCILFIIWLVLSGQFDAFHIIVGLLCCFLVETMVGPALALGFSLKSLPAVLRFFFMYLPWLMGQIIISNVQMFCIVFHPNLKSKIDPQLTHFKTRIKSETGRYLFANSITLTPGTTTVYASRYGDFSVHAINKSFADALPGKMEEMIIKMLGENDA